MDKLQKLIDIEEIKNLKHRYFRAIDMADFSLLDDVFAPDITIDYRGGTYRWQSEGKDTIKESLRHAFHNQTAAMHTAHHPEIEVRSESEAVGKWYLQDIFYNFDLGSVTQGTALYEDKYTKIDNQWLIQHSEYDRIWEHVSRINSEGKFTKILLKEKGIQKQE
ncbi:nuclear transport factor 2 family protein [Gammaproteobacteria bacterium]|nr:nuclear transport factor 2 family protein [Gammaproteobacteria bacterium]